jgi:hypothetical protein
VDQEWIEGRGVLSEYVAGKSGEGKAKTSSYPHAKPKSSSVLRIDEGVFL